MSYELRTAKLSVALFIFWMPGLAESDAYSDAYSDAVVNMPSCYSDTRARTSAAKLVQMRIA